MILFDKNFNDIEFYWYWVFFPHSVRLNLTFLWLSSWICARVSQKILHRTSRNFLLSSHTFARINFGLTAQQLKVSAFNNAETSTMQCKILSENPCKNYFYQNLFHLKYVINVNLKYFLGPTVPWSTVQYGPIHLLPQDVNKWIINDYIIIRVHSAFSLVASCVLLKYTRTDDVNWWRDLI